MLALAGFALLPVPYALLAGPLAGLLLLSRPATARERIWLAAAALALAGSLLGGSASVGQELIRAGALLFAGVFPAFAVLTRLRSVSLAAAAAGAAAVAVVGGATILGIGWDAFHHSVRTQLQDAITAFQAVAPLPAAQVETMRAATDGMARIFPALVMLGAFLGSSIASRVAGRVARHPVIPAPEPLSAFRFNDHVVWGAVATLAAALLPLTGILATVVLNLLVVWTGLYAARGLAVFAALAPRWPRGLRIALVLAAALLLPYAVGATLVMGLADTWFDFRRGLLPPPSEGQT